MKRMTTNERGKQTRRTDQDRRNLKEKGKKKELIYIQSKNNRESCEGEKEPK